MKFGKISLFAVLCVAMLSGCGKKKDVSDDFQDVQGTSLEVEGAEHAHDTQAANAMSDKKVEHINIDGDIKDFYFDVQDLGGKTNKVFTAKEVTMDNNYLLKLADELFDDGEFYEVTMEDYETLNVPSGDLFKLVEHEANGVIYSYYRSVLRGNVNGKPFILFAYFYNNEDSLTGEFSFDIHSIESWESEDYYAEYDEDEFDVECSIDLNQTILDGENMLHKLGYEGYTCVNVKGIVDQVYGAAGDHSGYYLVFAKEIEGSACREYMNKYFIVDAGDGKKTSIDYVSMWFNEDGLFLMSKKESYELDANSGKDTNIFGLEEAERVALKEIEKNLQDDGVLSFDTYFSTANMEEEDAYPVKVNLEYVPIMCDGEIVIAPVYLFSMDIYENGWGTETYIVAAVSALDGTVIKPDFF